jgi:predicted esterase
MARLHLIVSAITLCMCIACSANEPGESTSDMAIGEADMRPSDFGVSLDAGLDMTPLDLSTPDLAGPWDAQPDLATPQDMTTQDIDAGEPAGPSSERQQPRYTGDTVANLGYHEYLPPGYGDGAQRPLLIFWHGIGETGDGTQAELGKVLSNGPPRLIAGDEWDNKLPFVVLSPQHKGGGCPSAQEIETFTTYAQSAYEVDFARIYQTGLSCGAIGLWNYMARDKGSVTVAAVPIAGDGKGAFNRAGCDLGLTAIWAFHGDMDGSVNVSGTQQPIDQMLGDCPSPPRAEIKSTIYPGVAHNSWRQTYDLSAGHDIYDWLLTHKKSTP